MRTKKIVFFSAFKRVIPEDFENWLEKMASEGWHIERIRQWSSIIMIFRKGEPKKYRFVYDLRAVASKDYISTYKQFGWQFLGQMASVNIWRMEYIDDRPEAFSDKDSVTGRNKRTVAAVSISFSIFFIGAIVMTVASIFFSSGIPENDRIQLIIAAVFFAILAAALCFVMICIHKGSKRRMR